MLGTTPRRTASQLTYGGTWADRLGLSGGSDKLPIMALSSQNTEMTEQASLMPVPPSTSGEQPPLTVMIQRELGSHHHLGGGGVDQPDGPAAQLFIPPHPAPDSRIENIKIKLGLEDKKIEARKNQAKEGISSEEDD